MTTTPNTIKSITPKGTEFTAVILPGAEVCGVWVETSEETGVAVYRVNAAGRSITHGINTKTIAIFNRTVEESIANVIDL